MTVFNIVDSETPLVKNVMVEDKQLFCYDGGKNSIELVSTYAAVDCNLYLFKALQANDDGTFDISYSRYNEKSFSFVLDFHIDKKKNLFNARETMQYFHEPEKNYNPNMAKIKYYRDYIKDVFPRFATSKYALCFQELVSGEDNTWSKKFEKMFDLTFGKSYENAHEYYGNSIIFSEDKESVYICVLVHENVWAYGIFKMLL